MVGWHHQHNGHECEQTLREGTLSFSKLWRTGNPSVLQSMWSQRVGHDSATEHHPWWLGVFPGGSADKESACNVRDLDSIPMVERSPGEGNSYPPQYSGQENSMDCTVHGVAKSQTWLSNFHFHQQLNNNFSSSWDYQQVPPRRGKIIEKIEKSVFPRIGVEGGINRQTKEVFRAVKISCMVL